MRFTTATALINELAEAAHANQLSRALGRWERLDLICIDELGYVPLAETACELMFQVIADRAEKAAVIVTTNLPFSEWSQVIPNPRLCKALIDRLTDRRTSSPRARTPTGSAAPRRSARRQGMREDREATLTAEPGLGRPAGQQREVGQNSSALWAKIPMSGTPQSAKSEVSRSDCRNGVGIANGLDLGTTRSTERPCLRRSARSAEMPVAAYRMGYPTLHGHAQPPRIDRCVSAAAGPTGSRAMRDLSFRFRGRQSCTAGRRPERRAPVRQRQSGPGRAAGQVRQQDQALSRITVRPRQRLDQGRESWWPAARCVRSR